MEKPVALVTGVGRTVNIGAAVTRRLLADGYRVVATGLPSYDVSQALSGDPDAPSVLIDELVGEHGPAAHWHPADLSDPSGPAEVVRATVERFGRIDTLVACHTYSTQTPLGELVAAEIDKHLIVNVRATMLLVEAYAAAHVDSYPGRIVLFSSGQRLGPMPSELAYAATKAAVEYLIRDFSFLLVKRGITVNAINPGPNDTGWADEGAYEWVRTRFPTGRWGTPEDVANVISWLCSDQAAWVTAQVIDVEGGFNRYG